MTGFAAWPLQQAIKTALDAASALTALLASGSSSIVDRVPPNRPDSAYPFVVIGDIAMAEWDTKTTLGGDYEVVVHCWSIYGGNKEIGQIQGAVYDALHEQTLTVTGQACVLVRQRDARVIREPDGLTRHGVQRFQALLEESA